jgi:hypothetical protein
VDKLISRLISEIYLECEESYQKTGRIPNIKVMVAKALDDLGFQLNGQRPEIELAVRNSVQESLLKARIKKKSPSAY